MKTQTINLHDEIRERGLKLSEVALALGVHKSQVTRWVGGKVPPTRVPDFERVTGISRHVLRPDVFGPLQVEAAQ